MRREGKEEMLTVWGSKHLLTETSMIFFLFPSFPLCALCLSAASSISRKTDGLQDLEPKERSGS